MWVHKMYKKDEKVESVVRIHVRGTTGDCAHVGPLTARVARAARATYDEPPADVESDEFFTRVLDLGLPGRLLDAVLLIGTLLTAPLWRMRFFAHLGHWRAGGMELECAAIRRALQGLVTKSKRLPAQSHAVVAADLPALGAVVRADFAARRRRAQVHVHIVAFQSSLAQLLANKGRDDVVKLGPI